MCLKSFIIDIITYLNKISKFFKLSFDERSIFDPFLNSLIWLPFMLASLYIYLTLSLSMNLFFLFLCFSKLNIFSVDFLNSFPCFLLTYLFSFLCSYYNSMLVTKIPCKEIVRTTKESCFYHSKVSKTGDKCKILKYSSNFFFFHQTWDFIKPESSKTFCLIFFFFDLK